MAVFISGHKPGIKWPPACPSRRRPAGKVNDATDRGGKTNYGITQRVYNEWNESRQSGERDVWEISQAEVYAIYEYNYWNVCKCSQLPQGIDLCVFDAAVNHGPRKSIQFLQRAVGVVDDGEFGPQTQRAIDQDSSVERINYLLTGCLIAREHFYAAIVHNDQKQEKFLRGWMNRLNALRREVGVPV